MNYAKKTIDFIYIKKKIHQNKKNNQKNSKKKPLK